MLAVAEHEQLPVQAARAGDPAAWNVLFKRYQLPLYAYVFELVNDEQATLDIVQETFINASRHIGILRDDARFAGWLFGIAHQKCVQKWRKKDREAAALEELAADQPDLAYDPGELLIRREQEGEFVTLLNQLPTQQRSALLLHFMDEFALSEIADITGVSLGTVKSRIHYARKALGELLERKRNPQ